MKEKETKFYVYQLIDPRNDKVFYVGKGQKKRMNVHIIAVRNGRIPNGTNSKLGNKIRKILSLGLEIKYKKVLITENGKEAFNKEIELIAEIGLENLCNLTNGGEGGRHSEETRRKMSEANKGRIPWNKGKTISDETKKKISDSQKGRKFSKETKRKISESKKGHEVSVEIRRKLSESLKGRIPWNKGKTGVYSEETRKKMSESHKGKTGYRHSEETKRKMSEVHKNKK